MAKVPFEKYVSIGNDFVLVEATDVEGVDLSLLAQALCDRHFGVGSDGLLIVQRTDQQMRMRMFNPDGTEDFCGNGLRIAALHALRNNWFHGSVPILHKGKDIVVTPTKAGWLDVQLPRPNFDCKEVPARVDGEIWEKELVVAGEKLVVSSVCTGTTHTVIFLDAPVSEERFRTVSPLLEHHEWYPERTSVIWAWHTEEKQVEIRIWERGVGETLGCGTGSAAVAACWFRKRPGYLSLHVKNPGGDAIVAIGPAGSVIVSARAWHLFHGVTSEELAARYLPENRSVGCAPVKS